VHRRDGGWVALAGGPFALAGGGARDWERHASSTGRAVPDHHRTVRLGRTVLIVCSSASRRAARTSPSLTSHDQHLSVATQHVASRTSASS
jgi:hypothetical protein